MQLINKQSLIHSSKDVQNIAKNPMPPSISGYNDDIEGYEYDPEKAKELTKRS